MKTNNKLNGRIIAATDDMVTIRFSEDVSSYKDTMTIIVSIPCKRKTARGQVINVAEIIAYGKVSNISNNIMELRSNRNNPIISKSTLRDCHGTECVMMIEILK